MEKVLVGCIDTLDFNEGIKTRFFYIDKMSKRIKDVTLELCQAIESYNTKARKMKESGEYAMIIPYKYKYGMAEYSFGCGLSHYFQSSTFDKISACIESFKLEDCRLEMLTPNDLSSLVGCDNIFNTDAKDKVLSAYCNFW